MKKEIIDTLPHSSIKELIDLREYIQLIGDANSSEINEEKITDDSVLYRFRDKLSDYIFQIKFIKFENKNIYQIYYRPTSLENINGTSINCNYDQISQVFSRWIDNMRAMNKIKFVFHNPDGEFYNEQFADFFSNNDPDASSSPFEIERQEILYYFLTFAEKQVTKSENVPDEIKFQLIQEISSLKEDIPKLTKKKFVALLSKFAQQTKKVSNNLFHEVFDVLKKEIIKKILYEGYTQIPNTINKVEHWIHLLNS